MELLGKDNPDETVNDPPIPTLPVVVKVEELILVAVKAWRMEEPETVKPDNPRIRELKVAVPPIPTLPVKLDRPITLRPPLNTPRPVTVKEEPIPTLPVNCDIPVTLSEARFAKPVVFKVDNAAAELTVKDPPIPTLPVVCSW